MANKWLTVTPIIESDENPWWYLRFRRAVADLPGLDPRRTGRIGAVVAGYGPWADRDVQISGSPSMVQTTKFRLMAAGTPPPTSATTRIFERSNPFVANGFRGGAGLDEAVDGGGGHAG